MAVDASAFADVTVIGGEDKHSNINKACVIVLRKLQDVFTSLINYNLANAVENNTIGLSPFTRKDFPIVS